MTSSGVYKGQQRATRYVGHFLWATTAAPLLTLSLELWLLKS